MSVNKVILIGNIGGDVKVSKTKSGDSVCSFTIATSEKWKDKSGNQQTSTEWHNCVAWRKTAEMIGSHFGKGSEIYIEGKLKTESYDKDGAKHYTTKITVDNFSFTGGSSRGQKQHGNSVQYETQADFGIMPPLDDDMPF